MKRRAEELLAEWRARGVRDDVSAHARVGTRTVTVIGARPGDRDVPAVWLDPDYGVVRLVTRERLPNGTKLVDLTLSEHRPLAGEALFPVPPGGVRRRKAAHAVHRPLDRDQHESGRRPLRAGEPEGALMHFAFLGTSGARSPSAVRDTTSIVVAAPEGAVLLDCGGSPVQKLWRVGVDPLALVAVVVTHIHPDHSYGLPALVRNLAVLGRRTPLTVYCRPEHVEPLRSLLSLFNTLERPGMFKLAVRAIESSWHNAHLFDLGPLGVRTSPNDHGAMPNFAVRVDVAGRRSFVYSSGHPALRCRGRARPRRRHARSRGDPFRALTPGAPADTRTRRPPRPGRSRRAPACAG